MIRLELLVSVLQLPLQVLWSAPSNRFVDCALSVMDRKGFVPVRRDEAALDGLEV